MAIQHSIITAPQYLQMLEKHDWYYAYSDDHRKYTKGHDSEQRLRAIADQAEELKQLMVAYVAYIFDDDEKPTAPAAQPVPFNLKNLTKLVSDGQIFSVEFIRRSDGMLRKMRCRLGVRKHLKGGVNAYSPKEHDLLCVYDMEAQGYRSIPVDTVKKLTVSGQVFDFGTVEEAA